MVLWKTELTRGSLEMFPEAVKIELLTNNLCGIRSKNT